MGTREAVVRWRLPLTIHARESREMRGRSTDGSPPNTPVCVDQNTNCKLWSKLAPSDCTQNPGYKLHVCALSCQKAGFKPANDCSLPGDSNFDTYTITKILNYFNNNILSLTGTIICPTASDSRTFSKDISSPSHTTDRRTGLRH
jgi:hypothetical protein